MSCSKTTVDPKQVHLSSALTVLLGDHSSATWASRRETVPGHFSWEKCWYRGHFNPSFGYRLCLKLNSYSIWWPIKKVGKFNVSSLDFKMHPIFRQTLVSRIDGLAHVIWFNGKCRGNHVSLWIFSFKAQGSGGYPTQQRSNWVVDLFLPFTKNLNTIGEKHPMFQGGKPRQTSETIRYLAPKTIGKVFDVFESSVGLADEAFVGARPICLGWMWYPALAATWFQVRCIYIL